MWCLSVGVNKGDDNVSPVLPSKLIQMVGKGTFIASVAGMSARVAGMI